MSPKTFTILLILAYCCPLTAQHNPQPYFRNYGTEDGLPSPETYCVFEDSKGYMWFGTDNGAARFDGYEFKTYGPEEGLMSNVVFDIHEDGKGRIWFGTLTSEIFILGGDTIFPYQYNHVIKEHTDKFDRAHLAVLQKDGTTFIGVNAFGILKIDEDGKVDSIIGKFPTSVLALHYDNFSETIVVGSKRKDFDDYLFWSNYMDENLLFNLDIVSEKRRFQKTNLNKNYFSGTVIEAQKIHSGEVLVCFGNYLHCFSDTQLIWSKSDLLPTIEIIPEEDGTIWNCHSQGNGISRYSDLKALKNNEYERFLNGVSVSKLYKDSKGGIWVTSLDNGVYYCSDLEIKNFDSRFGFSENHVSNVVFKNKTELYAGCNNRDIFLIDIKKNKVTSKINTPWNPDKYSLFFEKESNLLYCGFSKWINEHWEYPKVWNSDYNKYVKSDYATLDEIELSKNNELIGAYRTGLYILDKNNHFIKFQSHNIKRERTYATHNDLSNRLWLGTEKGIFHFNFKDSTYIHPGISHPAFHNRVEDIDGMPDSTLVFGTKGFGVMFWKGDSILQVSNDDGLTSNMLEDVHVDENGNVWAGTLNGLNKISFSEDGKADVRAFTMSNGLPSNEIYQIKSYDGQVWLCTTDGLVKFHEYPENTVSPIPILQSVKMNDSEVAWSENQTFQYSENNFEFRYLAINYRMDGRIPYRYRLGKNAKWQYTQNLTVNYPSLPPGDYTFEVQAQNEDQYWSNSTTCHFSILPPWWATWWFRLVAAAAVTVAGFGAFRYRTRQLKRENEMQRQMADLEKSALQAQMNPHFIFNCLNSIQNFILKNDQKNAVEYLSKFARLVRHNLNASVNGVVSLEEEINILNNYLALEQQRFENKFNYKLHVDDNLKKENIEFPPLLIQPYVENAVIHGMSNEDKKGEIKIGFNKVNHLLAVTISDNGKGINNLQEKKSLFKHKSVGMGITRKRLELLDADNKNAVRINTLEDKNGKTIGTVVNILIKVKN